ncbi:AMP-binding enzyme family protein [Tritrichomonas foetus]|uniref:AMP-binding enzyme family protein n=1 Tax=Tritrichomonas foetus TaxID=1144522 RepID=A0A1J4K9W6_9EUKA|nr:AMP-binding enzyme family protein [Tritrichomonas foetus]|eukprot:OHT07746.1 AMP-binding enzyme family protein [Tritrichomonas foetus]
MGSDASCVISKENPDSPNESPIIWSPSTQMFNTEHLVSRFPDTPQISTIYELFEHTKAIAPDNDYYGYRAYNSESGKWLDHFNYVSRKDVGEMRDALGSCLTSRSLPFGSHIGILSFNRIEWIVVQHACFAFGYIPVPIYDTFGWDNISYIINHANINYVFIVSTKLKDFLKSINIEKLVNLNNNNDNDNNNNNDNPSNQVPQFHLVVFDFEEEPFDDKFIDYLEQNYQTRYDNQVLTININENSTHPQIHFIIEKFTDFINFPDRFPHRPPQPNTPASIMYTSGTTGLPKGCILTHANFIAAGANFYTYVYPFDHDDRYVSYLPLAHVYEAVMHIVALKVIGTMVFYSGSIPRLLEEVKMFGPTVFTGVTRVYERIMDGMQAKIKQQSALKQLAFQTAFNIKSFSLKYLRIKRIPLIDKVFDSIQEALGGNLRLFICGGSSLSESQQHWMRIACRLQFIQGYGLTETAASTCVQLYSDCLDGNVGVFLPCTEGKLRDLPDQGYFAKNFQGELLVRGPSVFAGYFKDEESTKSVLDNRGWFSTGDIFELTKNKQLKIISRCKELVKLSQGEYVAIAKLTSIYGAVEGVSQIYIHAGMEARFLTAIVVVDEKAPKVTMKEMLDRFSEAAKKANLNGFERIKAIRFTTTQFTTENGMATPSLKLCRFKIQQTYQHLLDEMDEELRSI